MMSIKDVFIYMFPGIMYFWIIFFGQAPMKEILDERISQTLARLLASPVTLSQFILSKILRCFLLSSLLQVFLLLVSAVFFDIRWGGFWIVFVAALASAFSITGVLALPYALARSREQAYTIATIFAVSCAILGGSFVPIENLPGLMQTLGRFTPNYWSITAFQTLAWSGSQEKLIRSMIILCAMGLGGSTIAFLLFTRLARGTRP